MMSKVVMMLALSILLVTNVEGKGVRGVLCPSLMGNVQCAACFGCTWYVFYCDGVAQCGNKPPEVKGEHLKLEHQETKPVKSSEEQEWDDGLEDY
uniref:Uncharacterized protein n=1 Tax=Plectus sambesii TaxID=2011161 RepID=A0A914X8G2_9BILA